MKTSTSDRGLTVRVIAGTYTTILAFDLTEEARVGCLGFSIARVALDDAGNPAGDAVWLTNRLRFAESAQEAQAATSEEMPVCAVERDSPPERFEHPTVFRTKKGEASTPPREKRAPREAPRPVPTESTERCPWQAFRYVDKDVEPGRRYRYTVAARRGSKDRLEDGPKVELTVTTEDPGAPHTAVHFNRAAASSQEYIERFGDADPEHTPEARKWLARGLKRALLDFLAAATGPGHELHAAIYEFQKRDLIAALAAARGRGVAVKVVYHGRQKRGDAGDHTARENAEAAHAGGLAAWCRPRKAEPAGAISHNKFVVLLEHGAPKAVWTGSTNWTDGALYGQLNVGHAVFDREVAAAYEAYFELLFADRTASEIRDALAAKGGAAFAGWRTVPEVRRAHEAGRGVWPIFSPQPSLAAITFYAEVCRRAEVVMVCAPFELHDELKGALKEPIGGETRNKMRFLLLDRAGNLGGEAVDVVDSRPGTEAGVVVTMRSPLHDYQRRVLMARESFHHQGVHMHAKVILADPLGPSPTVITGSANFSEGSTLKNDENTLVIRGDTAVADIYTTEFMRVFDAYHFRGRAKQLQEEGRPLCLDPDDRWSERYYTSLQGDRDRESMRKLFAGTDGVGAAIGDRAPPHTHLDAAAAGAQLPSRTQ